MMMQFVGAAIVLMVLILSGCSREAVYNSLRASQDRKCSTLPRSDQDECYRRSDMSYDEYQKQLQAQPK